VPPRRLSDPRRLSGPRRLSDTERAEWLSFAQALGTKPLGTKPLRPADAVILASEAPAPPVPSQAVAITPTAPRPKRGAERPKLGDLTVGGPAAGLDGASWDRLRRGRMRPERVLDLHGRTAQAAFGAFERFIGAARADGIRCVEIVTGRGAGEGGVLRRELPLWINLPQLRGAILAATHPHRANVGAVVLLLRRIR
jgi:DNA-nicking Smr family endonuclease